MRRSLLTYSLLAAATIPLGLATRKYSARLPEWIGSYGPDAMWAMLVFFLVALLARGRKTWELAVGSLVFSYLVEFSQLYHAPWIDAIRATTLGGLVLGFVFIPSDLLSYTVGVMIASVIDFAIIASQARRMTAAVKSDHSAP